MTSQLTLFRNESFRSHAGVRLFFKIDCDALSDEDIETLAAIVAHTHTFSEVVGIPRGGTRLADALRKYCTSEGGVMLAVDDVYTTGMSMNDERLRIRTAGEKRKIQGVVIFARGLRRCPKWVKSIFQLSKWAGP